MLSLLLLAPLLTDPPVPKNSVALENALEVIRTTNIRSDLHFIASDELEGRDTPSRGLEVAARFLRARMQRLGLEPGGDGGTSFFHNYSLLRAQLDLEKSGAWVLTENGEEVLEFGADYFLGSSGVAALDQSGPVVFAGQGAESDWPGLSLDGAWALVEASDEVPREDRARWAEEHGAQGLIVCAPFEEDDGSLNFMARRMVRYMERTHLLNAEPLFPQIYLTASGAAKLTGEAKRPAVGARLERRLRDLRVLVGEAEELQLENVAALWRGSHPELQREVMVLSAHYDHVGTRDGEIYNGADDNGSGTVALMALAEALATYGPMERSVLFLWVSGEEKGLKGSYAWTKNPTLPEGYRAVLNLNLDMISRNAPDSLLITPTEARPEYNAMTKMAEAFAPLEGFDQLEGCDDYWSRSDHANFARNLGIPVAFLFSDVHADYHKPTDTVEKIDYDKIRRVSRLILRMLDRLQSGPIG